MTGNPLVQQLYMVTAQLRKGLGAVAMMSKVLPADQMPELAEVFKCYENVESELQKAEDILKKML